MGRLVHDQTATEYFRELVESALLHQRLQTDAQTAYYLVNLLIGYVHVGPPQAALDEEPLAMRLGQALNAGGPARRKFLRQVGDASLFVSGYFSDSLRRKLVDVDYYAAVGGYAYASLSRLERDTFSPIFAELADKFIEFVDVLAEVSDRAGLTSNTDLLRLYEKWLRTGSRRDGELLAERGIVPNASIGSRFLQ